MRTPLLSLAFLLACTGDPSDDTDTDTNVSPVCLADDDKDGDGYCPPEDCDDTNLNVHPGANEIPYNNRDDDCDGVDVMDVDGDGFDGGADGDDCMDSNPDVYPGAPEPCYPDLDYNCDGIVSDDDCDLDGWVRHEDCDDEDDTIYPGAPDTWYDGVDSNCDNQSDFDADADGDDIAWNEAWPDAAWPEYIAAWDPLEPGKLAYIKSDEAEASWYDHGQDCDDNNPLVGGRLDELWDGVDRNCDGTVDAFHQNDAWKTWNGNAGAGGVGGLAAGDGAFTTAIAYLGDMNGDGFAEVAYSDLKAAEYAGRVYVISTAQDSGKAYEKAYSSLENKAVNGGLTGWDIANAGDLTGDGLPELLVGAPLYDTNGVVLVFDGADLLAGPDLSLTDAIAKLKSGLYAGMYTNALGDLNDDGTPEVISAAGYWSVMNVSIYDGAEVGDGGTFGTGQAESILSSSSRVGGDVVGTVDLTGDGDVDVMLASSGLLMTDAGPDCTSGSSQLIWGDGGDFIGGVIVSPDDLEALTGDPCAGLTLSTADDLDGDGYAELLVADPSVPGLDTFANGGAVYIINGDALIDGGDIASLATWTVNAEAGGAYLRVGDKAGDQDGDGTPDLLIGAPGLFSVYTAAQGIVAPSSANHLYWFETATLGSGGTFSTGDASADFYHQTNGSGLGTAWAIGPMDNTDSRDDVVMGAATQGTGGAFVFLSKF